MANSNTLLVAAATAAAAVGVYFGLYYAIPHKEEEGHLPPTATVENVFSGTIEGGADAAPESIPTQEVADASAASAETPAAETPADSSADATAADPAATDSSAPSVSEPVPEPAADAGDMGSSTSSAPAAAEPAAAPAETASSEPVISEPVKEASAPAPAKTEPSSRKPVRAAPPPADAVVRWWDDPSKSNSSQLTLNYAGQAAGEKSIALLFSRPFADAAAASSHLTVLSGKGNTVKGSWAISSNNPRLLLFRGLKKGRYTVLVAAETADSTNKTLGHKLSGPVYIQ